jgi:hypothetical protein
MIPARRLWLIFVGKKHTKFAVCSLVSDSTTSFTPDNGTSFGVFWLNNSFCRWFRSRSCLAGLPFSCVGHEFGIVHSQLLESGLTSFLFVGWSLWFSSPLDLFCQPISMPTPTCGLMPRYPTEQASTALFHSHWNEKLDHIHRSVKVRLLQWDCS